MKAVIIVKTKNADTLRSDPEEVTEEEWQNLQEFLEEGIYESITIKIGLGTYIIPRSNIYYVILEREEQ